MSRYPVRRGPLLMVAASACLVLMTLFALYPIWFAILASGRAGDRLYTLNLAGMFVPTEWTWENYRVLFTDKPFLTWIKNSLVIASSTAILAIFLGTSAAFAFSRFKFRGREAGGSYRSTTWPWASRDTS